MPGVGKQPIERVSRVHAVKLTTRDDPVLGPGIQRVHRAARVRPAAEGFGLVFAQPAPAAATGAGILRTSPAAILGGVWRVAQQARLQLVAQFLNFLRRHVLDRIFEELDDALGVERVVIGGPNTRSTALGLPTTCSINSARNRLTSRPSFVR